MRQKFFIQSFDSFDFHGCYADLHLSDYNFGKLKKIKGLSLLRWVTLVDGVLEPGKGTGNLEIGRHAFTVTYAWGGRGRPGSKSWNDRTSYTTRISTTGNDVSCLKEIMKQIIIDESGSLTKDIAFRIFHKDLNGPAAFCKRLEKQNVTGKM